MFYRFFPICNRLKRIVIAPPSLDEMCTYKEIICEAEQSEMPGVEMAKLDRDLVMSTRPLTTLEREFNRVEGYMGHHAATVKYTFNDALATPTGYYVFGASFSGSGNSYLEPLFSKNIPVIDKGFYASSWTAGTYFGHWLMDSVPTSLLRKNDEELYLWSPSSWVHSDDYLNALGIERVREEYVFFRTLSFCVDVGMNTNRRARISEINNRIVGGDDVAGHKKIYLSRGRSGDPRVIINELELQEALKKEGFRILHVSDTLEDIRSACAGAEITMSMEGSNVAHLIMCTPSGANHILLNPSDQFANIYADYMPALGDRLHNVVAIKEGAGYRVDVPWIINVIKGIEG